MRLENLTLRFLIYRFTCFNSCNVQLLRHIIYNLLKRLFYYNYSLPYDFFKDFPIKEKVYLSHIINLISNRKYEKSHKMTPEKFMTARHYILINCDNLIHVYKFYSPRQLYRNLFPVICFDKATKMQSFCHVS